MSEVAADRTARTGEAVRRPTPWWFDAAAIGGWTLGFALIAILGLSGGGYDAVTRGEAGIAAWWLAGAGVALGALALPRSRVALAGLVLFLALAVWTTLGLTWTESSERTMAEAARTAGFLGIFVLTLLACARTPARHVVAGLAGGIALIGGYAVLTRLQPDLFDPYALNEVFPTARRRLAQPLGYWNALAGLLAVGTPLLLAFATSARRPAVRGAAAAVVPVLVLAIFLTVSRGGVIAAAAAVVVWFALAPDRLTKIPVLAVVAAGSAILCLAADDRAALKAGLETAVALREGESLQTVVLLVMAGVALITAAIGLLDRHATRPRATVPARRPAGIATGAVALVALIVALAAGGPGWLDDRFTEFKGQSATPAALSNDNSFSRLSSAEGNGRYQYWVVSRDAQRDNVLTGIGPGTFEYLWARENTVPGSGFVRDAHSLYAEALGEMGLVGFLLVLGLFGTALVAGAARALRAVDVEHRAALAAATGGLVAFCVIASVEWAWEMTVLGAAGVALAAVCLAGAGERRIRVPTAEEDERAASGPGVRQRVVVGVLALVAIGLIAVPTSTTADIRDSQDAARQGNLEAAFRDARSASASQPYSASALLQEALVLERAGDLDRARGVAARATVEEPTNWRTWLIRSRLDARLGDAAASVVAYRRARALNPNSPLFAR